MNGPSVFPSVLCGQALELSLAQRVKVLQPCDKRQSRIAYRRFIEGHEQSLTFSLQPNCEGHGLHRAPFFF